MSYIGDPDVQRVRFIFSAAAYRDRVRYGPRSVCVSCRGNIERGGDLTGRMCRVHEEGRTGEACSYCGSVNDERRYQKWLTWQHKKHTVT